MSNLQIPNLPAAIALNGNELLEAVQAGTSTKITTNQLKSYIQLPPATTPSGLGAMGYAVAYTLDGQLLVSSAQVISRQLYQIKAVSQAPGETFIQIELTDPPAIVPTSLTFRCDGGRNGNTQGTHELQGDARAVVATSNPYRFNVPGVTYIAASIFTGGHCYVPGALIDASPLLNDLEVRLQAAGGGYQEWPIGGMYIRDQVVRCSYFKNQGGRHKCFMVWADYVDRPAGINRMLSTGVGTAESATNYPGYGYFHWEGLTLYGNRASQIFGVGLHAWQMGGDETVVHTGEVRDFGVVGSAGYGGSLGDSLAPRQGIKFFDYYCSFSDSDSLDMKDRSDANRGIHFFRPVCEWFGMGDTGTNLSGEIRPGANSITTIAASTICSIPLTLFPADCIDDDLTIIFGSAFDGIDPNGTWPITSIDATNIYFDTGQLPTAGGVTGGGTSVRLCLSSGMRRLATDAIRTEAGTTLCSVLRSLVPLANAGSRITFRTATSGDGVNPVGSWNVTTVDSTRAYFDTGQTPSVGGVSIGGANISYFVPAISPADCGIDLRGYDCSIVDGTARGDMWARSGFRTRAGESDRCVIQNCWGEDTTEAWIGDTAASARGAFISIGGINCIVDGLKYSTLAGVSGIAMGPTALNTQVCNYTIEGAHAAILDAGENSDIGTGTIVNSRDEGVRVHGRELRTAVPLVDPPFTPSAIGSAVVIVTDASHGLSTGNTVSFTGGTNMTGSGLVVLRSNLATYTITVLTADTYSIIATGSATSLTPFGEGDIFAFHGPNPHTATNPSIHNVTFVTDDAASTCAPIVVGRSPGFVNGYVTNCRIWDCRSIGSTGDTLDLPIVDFGTNTMWGQGNIGIFNAPTGADPAVPWTLVQELVVTDAAADIDFTNLRYYPEIRVEAFGVEYSDASNLAMTVSNTNGQSQFTTADYVRFGDTAITTGVLLVGSVAAGTPVAFDVEISNFNRSTRSFFKLCGGQQGAATANTVQSARTAGDADVALDALRISAAATITAGTFRIYQKGA